MAKTPEPADTQQGVNSDEVSSHQPTDPVQADAWVKMHRCSEVQKTIRYAVCGCVIVLMVIAICVAAVMLGTESVFWQGLAMIVGPLLAAGTPLCLFLRVRAKMRASTARQGTRAAELELMVDAKRTSSGLEEDGTNPPQDYIK